MTPRRLLPIAAWWHRARLHVVHHHVHTTDTADGPTWWHTYCATCAKGWRTL
ncbi:hypothetical protein SEA_GANCHO_85 [Mycobacterium phage Gancho]|uniref:Uncharacterized protein n=1 Tax=Mycobacterium phage Gancho TaxID=2301613 RepID=A0A385UEI9_9CAUD|nr:hypothetical protein SEA_GANCHO_85 [Mycobacterium phage Gancho]